MDVISALAVRIASTSDDRGECGVFFFASSKISRFWSVNSAKLRRAGSVPRSGRLIIACRVLFAREKADSLSILCISVKAVLFIFRKIVNASRICSPCIVPGPNIAFLSDQNKSDNSFY